MPVPMCALSCDICVRVSVSPQLCFPNGLSRKSPKEVALCFGMSTDSHSPRGAEKEGGREGQRGRKVCPFYQ